MVEYSIAINAGGQSTRMGTNKALVDLNGKPIIQWMFERLKPLDDAQEIFLVTNTPEEYQHLGLRMEADLIPDSGSLGGIYTAIQQSTTDYTLVLACDMPFISAELLRFMLVLCENEKPIFEVVVPRVDGYPQGLHAVYHKRCAPMIAMALQRKQLKVIGFYDNVQVRYVDEPEYEKYDPNKFALMNINTPDELARARFIEKFGK